jgi:hypothetical protein
MMQCSRWGVGPVDQEDGLQGLAVNNEITEKKIYIAIGCSARIAYCSACAS